MHFDKLKFITIAVLLLFNLAFAQDWQELKGEHFLVYFTQDEKFAREALDKAEVYYRNIATDLGYPRYSEFWTWEKRVKIYIHPDRASFLKATGQPDWSEGMADYKNKQLVSYIWSSGFLESLLPHEIAHLVFRDFVGFTGQIPLWLDEGVAQWEEEEKRKKIKSSAKNLFENDGLLLIDDIMKLDIQNLKDKQGLFIRPTITKDNTEGVLFLSVNNLIDNYYIQAASLVGFLIEKYGSVSFSNFCRELRDGKTVTEALKIAYPGYIKDLKELEYKWRQYLMS